MILRYFIFSLLFICLSVFSNTDKTLYIYHDADYSLNNASAESMKMGLLTAFNEIDNNIQGYTFKFLEKNHRGNTKRSYKNMQQFINDDKALFMLGGLHSPPYIQNRTFINENNILLLVPWAAGGPITRYPSTNNWVFRLSIDDTKAGIRMSDFALNHSCKNLHLLLEDTPWGKSNQKTMSSYLTGKSDFNVSFFGWNLKQNAARIILRNINAKDHDCILLVANYNETEQLINALMHLEENQRVPIISHWGATGGNVNKIFTKEVKSGIDFHVIQSCYSLSSLKQSSFQQQVINKAAQLFPEKLNSPQKVKAPAGFIHSYDLGRIIIAALEQITLTGNMKTDRLLLKNALEDIQKPVQGLIKVYKKPFSTWSANNEDAHEALELNDFCMASFGEYNQITLMNHK